ncbi:SDR family oxidoreductase [Cryobacterium sp. Hh7]|uniref:SDR family oxidoreductase n=1 Tax=Cryobacterium sp. Hh7 TaxID=1259159 RepID=UPI001068DB47|nr:SDR family oxidoreductase [Cryobacterium sp. Hh7]TFD61277.1 SDR family oxidoreductase [Cryobacterium sp. Hh7]
MIGACGRRHWCSSSAAAAPGWSRRHLQSASDPENFVEVRRQRNPLGRFLDADEVARTVEFAALDASGMTGSVLTIDAGLSSSFDFRIEN